MLLNRSFKESVHSVRDPFMERGVTTIATYNKDPIPFNKNLHSGSGTIRLHQARLTGFRRVVLETTILSNGEEHFGPTQSGPPPKMVPNTSVRPNRNGLFNLISNPILG